MLLQLDGVKSQHSILPFTLILTKRFSQSSTLFLKPLYDIPHNKKQELYLWLIHLILLKTLYV